ncbi:MAG TPA: ABC transporter permease subunit/CPBP intramembrane protease [Candidatus Obscuribacterales bacterium]
MNSSETSIVFLKELKDVLRDYRTLLMMIFIPTVFYPFFLVFPATMAQSTIEGMGKAQIKLGIVGDCPLLTQRLQSDKQFRIAMLKKSEYSSELKRRAVDAVLIVPDELNAMISSDALSDRSSKQNVSNLPKLRVVFDTTRENVLFAISRLYSALGDFRRMCVSRRLEALGLGDTWERNVRVNYVDTAPEEKKNKNVVAQSIPYLMVLMILIATMYPALDLITGERQRGTLALLLVAPVRRETVMFGKIAVVVLTGLVATIMGLASVYLTVHVEPVTHMLTRAHYRSDFSLSSAFIVALITLPLTVLISALSMYVAAWTRTFQQGQGYFFPLIIIALLMASASNLPDVTLASIAAFVPIANTSICLKEVLEGTYQWPWILITLATCTFYGWFLVRAAADLLDREDLLFGVAQSPRLKMATGDYGRELAVFFGVVFMLLFYGGQLATLWDPLKGNAITQTVLILTPAILFIKWQKLPLRQTLSFNKTRIAYLVAGLLLSFTTVYLATALMEAQSEVLPYSEEYAKQMMLLIVPPGRPLWQVFLVIAMLPAICEEILFRGLVLGVMKKRMSKAGVILLVGVLFGLFHLSLFRFAPTALLGFLLTWMVLRCGSIFPAMCLHMAHNGLYLWCHVNKIETLSAQGATLAMAALVVGAMLLGLKPGKE